MSIADELALLANTKESLRVAIGLSTSIPFSQYAVNMPWGSDVIPATGIVFDFKKNRYSQDGQAVYLGDVSEFIRLSSATMWQDGQLVEVQNNIPRISGEGLLIEPQRTNMVRNTNPIIGRPWLAQNSSRVVVDDSGFFGGKAFHMKEATTGVAGLYYPGLATAGSVFSLRSRAEPTAVMRFRLGGTSYNYMMNVGNEYRREIWLLEEGLLESSYNLLVEMISGEDLFWAEPQFELGNAPTSFIPTTNEPATRSPDILNIPLLPTQTITGDWDAGVTYEVADNIATFTGHGYIRNITVEAL